MSRSRANSNEGTDLYSAQPASQVQRDMIEAGRKRELQWLTHFTPGVENKASFHTEMADGAALLDKFRVTSGRVSGFMPHELRALERAYTMVERTGGRVAFVTIDQAAYDQRIACFDFPRKSFCTAMCLLVFIIFLLYFAYELNWVLKYNDADKSWLANAINGTTKYATPLSPRFETL